MTAADDDPSMPGAQDGRPGWMRGALAGALAILLVAAAGAGVFRGFAPHDVDRGDAVRRALVGALAGAAVGAVAIAAWNWYRHRRGLAAGSLGGAALAALLALLIGGGATLGASTAPPTTPAPNVSAPPPTDGGTGQDTGPDWSVPEGGAVLDASTGRAYLDTNGDGILDTELVPCPPVTTTSPTTAPGNGTGGTTVPTTTAPATTLPPYRVGDKVRVAIDNGCDGIIDQWIYVSVVDHASLPGSTTTVPRTVPPTPTTAAPSDDDGGSSTGTVLMIVLGLGVIALLILALRGWHPGPRTAPLPPLPTMPDAQPEVDEQAVADSLADSARRLLDDPDPRRAIIAAYAALLDGLADAGAPRATYEAPEEHLQRALRQLGVPPEPLAEVTRLFLIARFSSHPLGEPDREAARRALTAAERELRWVLARRATEQQEQQQQNTGGALHPPPPPPPSPGSGWAPPR